MKRLKYSIGDLVDFEIDATGPGRGTIVGLDIYYELADKTKVIDTLIVYKMATPSQAHDMHRHKDGELWVREQEIVRRIKPNARL